MLLTLEILGGTGRIGQTWDEESAEEASLQAMAANIFIWTAVSKESSVLASLSTGRHLCVNLRFNQAWECLVLSENQ